MIQGAINNTDLNLAGPTKTPESLTSRQDTSTTGLKLLPRLMVARLGKSGGFSLTSYHLKMLSLLSPDQEQGRGREEHLEPCKEQT
jgi:hypothetical protein